MTEFVYRSGEKVSTEGIVRLLADDGVYLERFESAGEQIFSMDWVFWQSNKTIKKIAKQPEDSRIIVSGDHLFALFDASIIYKYDRDSNEWGLWKSPFGKESATPMVGSNGIYRVIN